MREETRSCHRSEVRRSAGTVKVTRREVGIKYYSRQKPKAREQKGLGRD